MLEEIIARLRTHLPHDRWVSVTIAEDIDEFTSAAGQVASQSAIVMPWRERAERQALATGGFRQRVQTEFAIGMVLRDYSGAMGNQRAVAFDSLKSDIEAAIAGWVPSGFVDPCELIGGESSPISKGVSIYVQTWATARFLTGVSP